MNSTDKGTSETVPPFEVVALVASAGGVHAISTIVHHLPAEFPAAVIVVMHLGPGNNHLIKALAPRSALPLQWATRYEPLQPGRVYVCPPRQILWVQPDRTCDLEPYDGVIQAKPISAFLRSLGESYGPRALAVILTGAWNDGVEGVQVLKAAEGTVLVQSEESAMQPEMPRAAIATGVVDLVLPLQELAHVIPSIVAGGRLPRSYTEIEAVSMLFRGQDETSARLREVEWERTAFGPVSRWPTSLKATVQLMMDHRMALALFWGPELRLLYNDAYAPLLASLHPHAIGLPADAVYRDLWPQLVPLYQQVTSTGRALQRDDQHWTVLRDGRVEDIYATSTYSSIRDEQGMVQGVLLTVTETTRHMLTERRAATLHSLAARGLRLRDQHEVSEQAMQILGQNPDDVPFALLYLVDDARHTLRLDGATGTLAGTFAAPAVIHSGEGNPIWPLTVVLEQRKALLLDDLSTRILGLSIGPGMKAPEAALLLPLQPVADDQILGMLIIGLSERGIFDAPYREFLDLVAAQIAAGFAAARAAQHNAERLEALTALDRAKTDFFSNISHEFRTPLTLMLGPLEHIFKRQEQLPAGVLEDLRLIQHNASQLYKLVNTLLDFSRIEAKRARLNLQPTDLAALTTDLASLFRSAVEQAGLTFIVDCPSLPALVPVDREMWEKMVLNLLSNALKFTFSGSISLTLRALPQHVELIVADTGVGIAEEEQPHLFQRFHRIAETRGRTQQGSGIGLALVQEYTRLHNGRVRVRSQVGRGTTFTVWLPLAQPARTNGQRGLPTEVPPAAVTAEAQRYADEAVCWVQEESSIPATSEILDADIVDEQTPLPVFFPHARVLVVEDHADMRTYLQRLLSQHWQIQLATNGREALEQARSSPPDLILADVMMPEMDGFELLRHVRADEQLRTIPLLLMTARAGEEAAIEGLLAGADDYLIKPFSARELLARTSAQLELSRVRREGEQRQQFLLQLSDTLRAETGMEAVGNRAVQMIAERLGADRVYLVTLTPDDDTVIVTHEAKREDMPPLRGLYHSSDFPNAIREIFQHTIVYSDVRTDARLTDLDRLSLAGLGAVGFMAAPIRRGSESMIWAAGAVSTQPRSWTATEVSLFEDAVERTWAAVERARAEEALREKETEARARAEKALQASEERLRTFANSLPHLVWSATATGEIDFLNERMCAYAEMAQSEEKIYEWQAIIHPDDRETVLCQWEEGMRAQKAFAFNVRLQMKDGTYRWHQVQATPTYDANSSLSRWYGTMTDIEQCK